MKLLRGICAKLPDAGAVASLIAALGATGNTSISTFELLNSGTVGALRRYLQGTDLAEETPGRQQAMLKRLGEFSGRYKGERSCREAEGEGKGWECSSVAGVCLDLEPHVRACACAVAVAAAACRMLLHRVALLAE